MHNYSTITQFTYLAFAQFIESQNWCQMFCIFHIFCHNFRCDLQILFFLPLNLAPELKKNTTQMMTRYCGSMRAISQEILQLSITKIGLKFTYLKLYWNLSRTNELNLITDLDLHRFLPISTLKYFGGGLPGKCFRTQSIRNCLGDFPVHCWRVYSKFRLSRGAESNKKVK